MFMLNLSRHCGFHSETYSLSVNLLDRLLSVVKVCDVQLKGASYSHIEHFMILALYWLRCTMDAY